MKNKFLSKCTTYNDDDNNCNSIHFLDSILYLLRVEWTAYTDIDIASKSKGKQQQMKTRAKTGQKWRENNILKLIYLNVKFKSKERQKYYTRL